VCQVAWKFGKTLNEWHTGVIIPIFKVFTSMHSEECQKKYMPNAVKGNAVK